jgi:hypothetical protein
MRALFRSLFAAAVLVVLFTGHAGAAGAGLCDAFAAAITKRAAENNANQCGFSSRPNYDNADAQKRWCRSVTEETAIGESFKRDAESEKCAYCRNYSTVANAEARDNVLLNCGGTGPRWGFGEGHMAWCMAVERECGGIYNLCDPASETRQVRAETNARQEAIQQCRGKFTPAQLAACAAYAEKAVEQAKANDAKKCFTPGPRFSEDRDMHFSWCVGQIETDGVKMVLLTKQESDAREAENIACKPVRRLGKVKPGGKNQLRPIPSSGESPFGAADKSGQGGLNEVSAPAGKAAPSKINSNSLKAAKGGGGFNTAKPGGNSAMDRLGGGSGAVVPGSAAGASGRGAARAGAAGASSGVNGGTVSSPSAGGTGGSFLNRGPTGASAIQKPSQDGFVGPK